MSDRTNLVLGASPDPHRYSHLAVKRLVEHGFPVVAVGRRAGSVAGVTILQEPPAGMVVDTVTIYLNSDNQRVWEERLLALQPRRIIFNPGAENPQFARRAKEAGIEILDACTLVMLSVGTF